MDQTVVMDNGVLEHLVDIMVIGALAEAGVLKGKLMLMRTLSLIMLKMQEQELGPVET